MDFALNDEQKEFKARCRKFAREVIRPAARKHDEEESIPWGVIKEARKQGFGTLESIQRSAADSEGQFQVISAEEFHWGCAGTALAMPPPLSDGMIAYHQNIDAAPGAGVPETVEQYARDVTAFLMWAAEPKLEERKRMGFSVMGFLILFAGLVYYTKRKVWSEVEH